jgi:hypothetical protein
VTDTRIDQPTKYREYFDIVKAFNTANKDYLNNVAEFTNRRQLAIKGAIEIHLNPVLSTMKTFRIISIVAVLIAVISFCGGVSLNNTKSQGWEVILILFALGLGLVAIIVLIWSSAKISDINSQISAVQTTPPPVITS